MRSPFSRPSVLVAVMGPYPMDYGPDKAGGMGSGNTRVDLHHLEHATKSAKVSLFGIPDLVPTVGATEAYNPEWGAKHRGLHAMRCRAAEKARAEGWDYLFIVENDVVLAPDTLDRLLARQVDLVVPRHEFPDFPIIRCMVYQPVPPQGTTGLWPIEWCGYPATLYRMAAFGSLDPMFVGGGEGFDYRRWHEAGIETWMDLDLAAVNLRLAGPHEILAHVPGAYTNHLRRTPQGEKVQCHGAIYEYRDRDGETETYHLACRKCKYRVDFTPPQGYRSEALRVSGILERAVAHPGVGPA